MVVFVTWVGDGRSKVGTEVAVAVSGMENRDTRSGMLTVQCQRDKHKVGLQCEDKRAVVLYSVWRMSNHGMLAQPREWVFG